MDQRKSFSRLCLGEVGLNGVAERTPALANGDSSTTPAGGWEVSVAVAAPAGSSEAVATATGANVTTTSPCSPELVVAVIVASAAFRNASAAVSSPGAPGAQAAPAAPSGQGGWTIECS